MAMFCCLNTCEFVKPINGHCNCSIFILREINQVSFLFLPHLHTMILLMSSSFVLHVVLQESQHARTWFPNHVSSFHILSFGTWFMSFTTFFEVFACSHCVINFKKSSSVDIIHIWHTKSTMTICLLWIEAIVRSHICWLCLQDRDYASTSLFQDQIS